MNTHTFNSCIVVVSCCVCLSLGEQRWTRYFVVIWLSADKVCFSCKLLEQLL